MKKFLNSFCAVFVLTACLFVGCKAPSGGGGSEQGGGGGGASSYKKIGTQEINGKSYDIVTFGTYPQSEKTDDAIIVDESVSKIVGSYTYYKGTDNEWYAKVKSKYYKVEPIVWRVLTDSYDHDGKPDTTGKKLLLSEKILINNYYDRGSNSYANSSIRLFLIGEFFSNAFTEEDQNVIATTSVVNNARSTNPDSNATQWDSGNNRYTSDIPTKDKIFLLSEQEVTKADYGFAAYNAFGIGNTRIRFVTAFANASGTSLSNTSGYGGFWFLRSPSHVAPNDARFVDEDGDASKYVYVYRDFAGVVPALCLN